MDFEDLWFEIVESSLDRPLLPFNSEVESKTDFCIATVFVLLTYARDRRLISVGQSIDIVTKIDISIHAS